jgi:raffinose/stachyose/melibiose transport system permease protein
MQTLRYIIFPALSGVIVTTAILAISGSLKSFDLIYVMTQGGPAHRTSVLALYMYEKAFRGAPNYPVANAISTIMVIISFVLIVITRAVEKHFSAKE